MQKKIFKSMCLLTLVAVVLSSLLTALVYYASFDKRMKEEVREETQFVRSAVELSGIGYLEKVAGTPNRITLVDTDGTVLYDNQAEAASMENHGGREEVREALTGGAGEASRVSGTLSEQTFYYAVKLQNGQVLRVAAQTESVFAALVSVLPWMVGGGPGGRLGHGDLLPVPHPDKSWPPSTPWTWTTLPTTPPTTSSPPC